jgi:hypothetical protein
VTYKLCVNCLCWQPWLSTNICVVNPHKTCSEFYKTGEGARHKQLCILYLNYLICIYVLFIKDNYISKCLKMKICKRLGYEWGIKASHIQPWCLVSYLHNGIKVAPSYLQTLWVYSVWISSSTWINITTNNFKHFIISEHTNTRILRTYYFTLSILSSIKRKVWSKIKLITGHPQYKLSNTNELRCDMNDG